MFFDGLRPGVAFEDGRERPFRPGRFLLQLCDSDA
jgi:hypothetical protein